MNMVNIRFANTVVGALIFTQFNAVHGNNQQLPSVGGQNPNANATLRLDRDQPMLGVKMAPPTGEIVYAGPDVELVVRNASGPADVVVSIGEDESGQVVPPGGELSATISGPATVSVRLGEVRRAGRPVDERGQALRDADGNLVPSEASAAKTDIDVKFKASPKK